MRRLRCNPAERPGRSTPKPASSRVSLLCALLLVALAPLAGCDAPTAFGDADSLIVVADSTLWAEMEQETYEKLEPTLFTVRPERTFHVTYVPRDGSELEQLLMWRQVLVFGPPSDPLIQEIGDSMMSSMLGRT